MVDPDRLSPSRDGKLPVSDWPGRIQSDWTIIALIIGGCGIIAAVAIAAVRYVLNYLSSAWQSGDGGA